MKIVINSAALLRQLKLINGVIPSHAYQPILENFLFDIEGNKLIITASDLQNTMTAEIAVDSDEDSRICIPAKMLIETLQNLPEQPITIKANMESFAVEIVSDKGRYRLAGEDASDYPLPKTSQVSKSIEIGSEVLKTAISYTLFAVCNDDMKPSMGGVYVNINENRANFVATDSHRLVEYKRTDITSSQEISVTIPKKAVNLLKNALPTNEVPVTVEFSNSNAFLTFANMKLVCRLVDERFPDYEAIIPLNNGNVLTLPAKDTLAALKRISIYANKSTNLVRVELGKKDYFNVSAEDLDFSNEANETLQAKYDGEPMIVGFQVRFLSEMLSVIATNEANLSLSTPQKAVLIEPTMQEPNQSLIMLLMPISLNSNY